MGRDVREQRLTDLVSAGYTMELRQLEYFVAVAQMESFTQAAQRCGVSQPSLSQQIAKLESEFKQPLFERLGRKTRLTEAGRALLLRATAILDMVEDAKLRIGSDAESGRFSVGAIPTVAPFLLPTLLKVFLRQFPNANVTVSENVTAVTVAECLEGNLDLAIVALPINEPKLHVESFGEEEFFVVMSSDHRLAKRRSVKLEDLREESFVLLDEAHCLTEQTQDFCRKSGFRPIASCQGAQLMTVQELVGLHRGVSLIPAMARGLDKSKQRVYARLSGEKPHRTLAMIWRNGRFQSPLTLHFIRLLREFDGSKLGLKRCANSK